MAQYFISWLIESSETVVKKNAKEAIPKPKKINPLKSNLITSIGLILAD
jgi:hypothetical protein